MYRLKVTYYDLAASVPHVGLLSLSENNRAIMSQQRWWWCYFTTSSYDELLEGSGHFVSSPKSTSDISTLVTGFICFSLNDIPADMPGASCSRSPEQQNETGHFILKNWLPSKHSPLAPNRLASSIESSLVSISLIIGLSNPPSDDEVCTQACSPSSC